MATDDQQVLVTGTASAPASWTVPGNGQIRPKAIYATFDGTGASGDFMPFLEIISDGGEVIAQSAGSTVTAGGSVDQSWFPFVAAAAATSSFVGSWATLFDSAISVAAGATYTQYDFTAATFYTNDSATFTVDATNGLTLNSQGWYQYSASLFWEIDGATTGTFAEMEWSIPNIGHRFTTDSWADATGGTFYAATTQAWGFPMNSTTVGSHGKLFLRQFSDAAATVAMSFSVALLTSDTGNF